jgi:hypothetical protein
MRQGGSLAATICEKVTPGVEQRVTSGFEVETAFSEGRSEQQ